MDCTWLDPFLWRAPRAPALLYRTCAGLALLMMFGGPAWSDDSPVTTTAGYEYYTGPDHQFTRTLGGELEAHLRSESVSLSLGRFDDESAGAGLKVGAGLGLPLAPRTQIKLAFDHALGDSSYKAWELRAGPAIKLLRGETLTLTYVHSQDNQDATSNGASTELEVPLIGDHLGASGSVSYARVNGLGGLEGMAGLSASLLDHLEIEGELGYSQTGISLHGLFPGHDVVQKSQMAQRGRKRTGGTSTTGPAETPGAVAQLAVRFSFP